jgi:hypothetical protein
LPGFAGRLGSSIDSRSVSGSRTGSRMPLGRYPVPSAGFQQGSSSEQWYIGKNNISDKLHERLVEELNVNPLYADRNNRNKQGLRFAWGRYLECSDAIKRGRAMNEAGTWPADIPPFTEYLIVDIFIGKTTWYTNYVKIFEPVNSITEFSNMKAWLDDENPDPDDTEDIWGEVLSSYKMEDLREWVKNNGTLKKRRRSPTPDEDTRSKGKQRAHRKK